MAYIILTENHIGHRGSRNQASFEEMLLKIISRIQKDKKYCKMLAVIDLDIQ